MLSTTARKVVLAGLLVGVLGVGSSGCFLVDWFTETTHLFYEVDHNVSYIPPDGSYSGPPVVAMWRAFYGGSGSLSQADIWDHMDETDVFSKTFDALHDLSATGSLTTWVYYDEFQTCNGGRDCVAQGIADIKKALEHGDVVAMSMQGLQSSLAYAYGVGRACKPVGGCQPSFDFLQMHSPNHGGAAQLWTVPGLRDHWDGVVAFSHPDFELSMSNDDWADFDYAASTYYGDPDPPEPNCPPFCGEGGEEDPPEMLMGQTVAAPEARRLRRPSAASGRFIPNPTTTHEVVSDFLYAVRRLRLAERQALAGLGFSDGGLTVARVLTVRSLGDFSDYYLLSLVDRRGAEVARATIDSGGYLGVLAISDGFEKLESSQTVKSRFESAFDLELQANPEMVYAHGGAAGTLLAPAFMGHTTTGRTVIIPEGGNAHYIEQGESSAAAIGRGLLLGKAGARYTLQSVPKSH